MHVTTPHTKRQVLGHWIGSHVTLSEMQRMDLTMRYTAEDARPGQGVKSRLPEGTRVAVPRALWPDDECNEMGGEAWHATVISSTGLTAVVEFAKARSKSGHAYKDVRLPLCALRLIA